MSEQAVEKIIEIEEETLKNCLDKIKLQITHVEHRFHTEEQRSREMSSAIVATRRGEDKALLMSDEQVAHRLRDQQCDSLETLEKQKYKPYFARLVLLEETEQGHKEIEYRLGQHSNSDCRIVDWRHAPISRIYYEYLEGEEYCEEIQGRERFGTVQLRNSVEIVKSELKSIKQAGKTFIKTSEGWQTGKGSSESLRAEQGAGYQSLPAVLPIITAEQYKLITSEPETSIIIQGIAGSGKTTVALHRLSWLLHQKDCLLERDHTRVISRSELLKNYIINSAQKLDLEGVKIQTYQEWLQENLKNTPSLNSYTISNSNIATSINRGLSSLALLTQIENSTTVSANQNGLEHLIDLLSDTTSILNLDQTKLLSRELLLTCREHLVECLKNKQLSIPAATLLIRLEQIQGRLIILDHLVLDESQDYWPAELKVLISAVGKEKALTAVGDTSQNIFSSDELNKSNSTDWRDLLKIWWKQQENFNFISLNVSHRNTVEIMQFAQQIQNLPSSKNGRHGRTPIWFNCASESAAIKRAQDWLSKANNLYPTGIQAVICADQQQAQQTFRFLEPFFGSSIVLASGKYWSDSGLVVLSVKQSKGLEFTNVLIWDANKQNYPNSELGKNLLYTAVTRAESNLAILTWGSPSALLPNQNSKLIRYVPPAE